MSAGKPLEGKDGGKLNKDGWAEGKRYEHYPKFFAFCCGVHATIPPYVLMIVKNMHGC